MKVNKMGLRDKHYSGDIISIPLDGKYVIGVIEQVKEDYITMHVQMKQKLDGDEEFRLVVGEDGHLTYGVVREDK